MRGRSAVYPLGWQIVSLGSDPDFFLARGIKFWLVFVLDIMTLLDCLQLQKAVRRLIEGLTENERDGLWRLAPRVQTELYLRALEERALLLQRGEVESMTPTTSTHNESDSRVPSRESTLPDEADTTAAFDLNALD